MFDNFDEDQIQEVQGLIKKQKEAQLSLNSLELEDSVMVNNEAQAILAVVFDLLFASLYEQRFQMFEGIVGEQPVRSIVTLSTTLSWHIDPQNWSDNAKRCKAYLVNSYRRVLTYGFYRNFSLCEKIKEDLSSLTKYDCVAELDRLKECFDQTSDLDMRWTDAYLPFLIKFAKKVPASLVAEYSVAIKNVQISKEDLCF